MILSTLVLYNLRMCMKEDNPGLKYLKGGNLLREIILISSAGQRVLILWLDLTHSSSFQVDSRSKYELSGFYLFTTSHQSISLLNGNIVM